MTDRIAEQNYINAVMTRLPEVADKKEHVLQKGENLWTLAKKELNKKNASNQEINNYMLLIAKLNNLTTVEKMNGLKVSDKIYLPESVNKTKSTDKVGQVKKNSENLQKPQKPLSNAEQTVDNKINTMMNDKTVFIKQATPEFLNLYHIFQEKKLPSGLVLKEKLVLSFKVNDNGKIGSLMMDDDVKRLHSMWYDYDVKPNGEIKDSQYPRNTVVKLPQDKNKKLYGEIERLFNEYKNNKNQ